MARSAAKFTPKSTIDPIPRPAARVATVAKHSPGRMAAAGRRSASGICMGARALDTLNQFRISLSYTAIEPSIGLLGPILTMLCGFVLCLQDSRTFGN